MPVAFAHPSEREVASLLDAYGIRWEYEPTTFVLSTDAAGNPTSGFTPDFHLTDFDVYVEVTTVRQALVTRKRRKIRAMARTHPDVRVTLLDRSDIGRLAEKYGLAAAA